MSRQVLVNVEVRLIVNLEEGEIIEDMVQEMEYDFTYCPDNAENRIINTVIADYRIID
jgi:phosphoribosylformylglycinamidine (FGAM) synthase PurS component